MRFTFLLLTIQVVVWGQSSGLTLNTTDTGTALASYRAFFHHDQYLKTAAKTANAGEAADVETWHQKYIGLNDQESGQLHQIAAMNISAVDALEKQAAQI